MSKVNAMGSTKNVTNAYAELVEILEIVES